MFGQFFGVAYDMTDIAETPKGRLCDRDPVASVGDERNPLLN